MALKETVFIMFFILSPIVADLGEELQEEIDKIKQVINKQVLKALDDLSTKAGKCVGNLALSKNVENGRPVRVIRGYKSKSPFAPDEGYRYDGLYSVVKYWQARGLSGFLVYKFALKRCDGQAPPPWEQTEDTDTQTDINESD